MKNLNFMFILILISLISVDLVSSQNSTCVYFFYGDGCQHCAKVEPFVDSFGSDVELIKFEVYNNRSNLVLLNQYFDVYNIRDNNRGVPVIFVGNNYLVGDNPIFDRLEESIENNIGANCPSLDRLNVTGTAGSSSPLEKLNGLSLFTIIGAALVDSVNPCAIAVLLILIGALLASGDKKKAFKAGLAFTLSIYIAYFLFGIGLFSAIQISGLSYWFYKIIGGLAVIIGLANIKDYFWYGKGGFVMEIPRKWRPKLKGMLSKITSPFGAFLIGFVVCLFELPCTGGPYIVILGLLAERMTLLAALPLLLIYNLFFVLPLLIITFMIYYGFANIEKTNKWKEMNIRKLHLFAGLVMLILGALIIFNLV